MPTRLMPAPSDGRCFTQYASASRAEEDLKRRLGARTEAEYRWMLQNNSSAAAAILGRLNVSTLERGMCR